MRIGLTGGIGSGKSTASAILATFGAQVIDTDAIARQLSEPGGAAIAPLRADFGDAAIGPDGALDRGRMRSLVFTDPGARQRLEAILHPLIGAETERQAHVSAAPVLVFDVPLLVESGRWRQRVERVLVVDCEESTQVTRVSARPGWTAPMAQAVIAQQASRELRRTCADAVLCNDGVSLVELKQQLLAMWHHWHLPMS